MSRVHSAGTPRSITLCVSSELCEHAAHPGGSKVEPSLHLSEPMAGLSLYLARSPAAGGVVEVPTSLPPQTWRICASVHTCTILALSLSRKNRNAGTLSARSSQKDSPEPLFSHDQRTHKFRLASSYRSDSISYSRRRCLSVGQMSPIWARVCTGSCTTHPSG